MAYTFKHGDRPLEGITIQRAVGRGGFGEVYYALTDSGKQVAVKYLRDNQEIELRGVTQVMNLKSPHLITIYDVRRNAEGDPFVIMEYVSGPSLRDLLTAEPHGLGPQKAVFFVDGVAKGLSYLHERGIVHRDLKPGNIFYDDGYVKIGDYGLSKHIAVSAHSGNTISVGTVHYMAPEIGSGHYTRSIDIYALGVMLYEMLTGRLPFTGSSMGEILMRHLRDQPDVTGIPEPFAGVIARALAKDPRERYQDVQEMVEALIAESAVSESLASFDASILTQVPRARDIEADRTRTTPPQAPAVPALDARAAELELPPLPPIPPLLDRKAARRARKLQQKARKLQAKAEKKACVVRAKLADLGVSPGADAPAGRFRPGLRKGWQQVLIAIFVLFAAAAGLGIWQDDPLVFAAALLYLLGGTTGTLIGYRLSLRRNSAEYDFQDRLLHGVCGFVFMLPGFAVACVTSDDLARLVIPLTGTLLLFNWGERIRLGRRQLIQGGTVFWHGVAGAILAAIVDAERHSLVAAVLCAVLLILVQTVAGIWPLPIVPAGALHPAGPRRRRAWQRLEGVYERATTAIENVGRRLERSEGRRGQKAAADAAVGVQVDAASETAPAGGAAAPPAGVLPPVSARSAESGYQPSFVGRTANAGLSFLAKLLLLAALAIAVLYNAQFQIGDGRSGLAVSPGRWVMYDVTARDSIDIPKGAVALPLLLGTIFLVVARRHDNVAHFLRAFFGCVLAGLAALCALGPAAPEMALLFQGDWVTLQESQRLANLVAVGALLVGACLLLFWPRPYASRERPIVI